MVADAEARVGLDVVAGELAEPGPAVEEAGPAGDDRGHGVAPRRPPGAASASAERGERVGGLGVEHGLREALTARSETGWSVMAECRSA